ncbi:MAG: DUF58 domain-containing protein [Promethearchaeota archaeon]
MQVLHRIFSLIEFWVKLKRRAGSDTNYSSYWIFSGGICLRPRSEYLILLCIPVLVIFSFLRLWMLAAIVLPFLIIFFFSLFSNEITIEALTISRKLSRNKTEVKGDLINVELTIQNEGPRIALLEIVDTVPEECTVNEGSNHWLIDLNQGEEITLTYAIQCHRRGNYALGPVVCRGSDMFRFYSTLKEYPVFTSFTVVPYLIRLKSLPFSRHRLLPEAGNIPSPIYKGRDFDFQGVRDYQLGDELRTINWRVTAKFNTLATNEFALDQSAQVCVILDHTTSTERVLEEGVMAALSASEYLISQRNKLGFFGIGELVNEIPAMRGKRQLLRISDYLIDVRASSPSHDGILKNRLNIKLRPALSPFVQIIFISPLYSRIMLEFLLDLAKQSGDDILLILPRLESYVEKYRYNSRHARLANTLLALDRAYVLDHVSKFAISQIHWFPNGPKYEIIKLRRTK